MVNRPKRKLPTPLNHGHDPDDEVGDFGGSLKIRVFHIIRLDPNIVKHYKHSGRWTEKKKNWVNTK